MIRKATTLGFIILALSACSSFMHGYTSQAAMNQYLQVDEARDSFGFERLQYTIGYRGAAFRDFIEERGTPDYIYEYVENERAHINLYYVGSDTAYIFKEQNWRPTSLELIMMRHLTTSEKARFGIIERRPFEPVPPTPSNNVSA